MTPNTGDTGILEKDGYRIGHAVAEGVLLRELLAKPRFLPMMAVKAKIRFVLAGEGISEVG